MLEVTNACGGGREHSPISSIAGYLSDRCCATGAGSKGACYQADTSPPREPAIRIIPAPPEHSVGLKHPRGAASGSAPGSRMYPSMYLGCIVGAAGCLAPFASALSREATPACRTVYPILSIVKFPNSREGAFCLIGQGLCDVFGEIFQRDRPFGPSGESGSLFF